MTKRFSSASKLAAISLAVAAAVAMPLSASARGWGGHGGGWGHGGSYHGGYYGHGGGHWSGGRWIAGAIVTGAVLGVVADALSPRPVYYGAPVVYAQPGVVYEDGPPVVVRRRVVETRTTVYDDPQQTRYIGDDGYSD
ncbi:hypothetical protein GCM10008098_05170 [Rhodanobacter panaciterrae]|uniref:PXPV repeat-containing protein n=1 Tax=Rhodanobacter panaciterrae TaxID=490572 RepID=A0ABQ2ZJE5_9GAMM|nr:hypothetical protein [Rhodanobacter panaciterrae]GGY16750.1 hypothetical protein GCM10008098_05170 [Rhodanobacter panaciterrae]